MGAGDLKEQEDTLAKVDEALRKLVEKAGGALHVVGNVDGRAPYHRCCTGYKPYPRGYALLCFPDQTV